MPRRRARSLGFTLVEIVVVVGIVGILGSVSVYAIQQSRENSSIERAAAMLRIRLERAQALSAVAGSRIGTNRLAYGAGCPQVGATQMLWVQVDPAGTAVIPANLSYDGGTDLLTVQCETFNIANETRGFGAFSAPAALTRFTFTTDGRVVLENGGTGSVYVGVRHTTRPRQFGIRVLPSGVICPSGRPNNVSCDEDA